MCRTTSDEKQNDLIFNRRSEPVGTRRTTYVLPFHRTVGDPTCTRVFVSNQTLDDVVQHRPIYVSDDIRFQCRCSLRSMDPYYNIIIYIYLCTLYNVKSIGISLLSLFGIRQFLSQVPTYNILLLLRWLVIGGLYHKKAVQENKNVIIELNTILLNIFIYSTIRLFDDVLIWIKPSK
jgi:hypothetical protein